MTRHARSNLARYRRLGAFTIIELLCVLGVIAILLALLLLAISAIRERGNMVRCAGNLRQICMMIEVYVTGNRGYPPPNVAFTSPGTYWYDEERVCSGLDMSDPLRAKVLACPSDDGGMRSYAMNAWMSSVLEDAVTKVTPTPGLLWGKSPTPSSSIILVVETWSSAADRKAPAVAGFRGDLPGRRFGVGGGVVPFLAGRFGKVISEVDFGRHRVKDGKGPRTGATTIGYADGHVESHFQSDLASPRTGLSTLQAIWSPLDVEQNR